MMGCSNRRSAKESGESPWLRGACATARSARSLRLIWAAMAAATGLGCAFLSWFLTNRWALTSGLAAKDFGLEDVAASSPADLASGLRRANEWLKELARKHRASAEALSVAAQGLLTFGRSEEAVRLWEWCLQVDPRFVPAICGLAQHFADIGDSDRALRYFRLAAELEPDMIAHRVKIAQELMRLGASDEVIALLEPLLRQHPNDVALLVILGQAYVHKKDYEKAVPVLERAINLAPTMTNAYYTLAQATFALGEKELAKEYLKIFQQLKENDEEAHRRVLQSKDDLRQMRLDLAEFYSRIAATFLAVGDPTTAELILREARTLSADSNPPFELMAWLYHRQGRRKECLAVLETLAEREEYLPGQLLCASLFDELGMFDRAEKALRQAIALAPHQAPGYAALARLYLRSGKKLPTARAAALRAVDLEPSPANLELLAAVCHACGDFATVTMARQMAAILEPLRPDQVRK